MDCEEKCCASEDVTDCQPGSSQSKVCSDGVTTNKPGDVLIADGKDSCDEGTCCEQNGDCCSSETAMPSETKAYIKSVDDITTKEQCCKKEDVLISQFCPEEVCSNVSCSSKCCDQKKDLPKAVVSSGNVCCKSKKDIDFAEEKGISAECSDQVGFQSTESCCKPNESAGTCCQRSGKNIVNSAADRDELPGKKVGDERSIKTYCMKEEVAMDDKRKINLISGDEKLEQTRGTERCCKNVKNSEMEEREICCNKRNDFAPKSCFAESVNQEKRSVQGDLGINVKSTNELEGENSCCNEKGCAGKINSERDSADSSKKCTEKKVCKEKCSGSKKNDGFMIEFDEQRKVLDEKNQVSIDVKSCSSDGKKKLLAGNGGRVSYGSAAFCEPVEIKDNKGKGYKYSALQNSSQEIESDSKFSEIFLEERPGVITTTKIRVQNICCGKEADLIKRELEPLNGVKSVSINIVGRIGFVKHDKDIISAVEIINKLNQLHLGVSIMESGDQEGAQVLRRDVIVKLGSKCAVLGVLLALFIVVIIGRSKNYSWQKWVAIAEIIVGSLPILRKAILNWMKKVFIDINVLMLIAVAGTIALQEWIEGATLVFVFAIAEVLQQYCGYKVQAAISGILVHVPDHAVLAETGKTVPVEEIEIGTRILVCAGEKIALDGDVVKGQASVDESSITGESMPIEKAPGCKTFSGTIVQSGYLEIKTTSTSEDSTVSKVTQMVQEAQAKASHTEKMMNQFAKIYTPLVLVVALLVFAVPAILAELKVGSYASQLHAWGIRALIVLLVACPCALVMSVPIPMVCGITTAAKNGALIKSGNDMELLAGVEAIAFDKTGTLTEGRFKVVNLKEFREDIDYNEMLQMVAALEMKSSHPVAAAIVNHYAGCITDKIASFGAGVGLPDVDNFKSLPGLGLIGNVHGHAVAVGNVKLLRDSGVKILLEAEKLFANWSHFGQTVIFCSVDSQLSLMMGLADTPRDTAKQALDMLQNLGITTIMLTGDSSGAASAVSKSVGTESYIANMKPEHKLRWIRSRQENSSNNQRTKVVMIGDGVNDGPSLAAADVGIAIGTCATALAIESANVALMTDNLVKIPELLLLSLFTKKVVIQNIGLALAIKVAVIIATMAGVLVLWMAILSDVLALLLVILNGLRPLLWKREDMRGSRKKKRSWNTLQDAQVFDYQEDGMTLIEVKT